MEIGEVRRAESVEVLFTWGWRVMEGLLFLLAAGTPVSCNLNRTSSQVREGGMPLGHRRGGRTVGTRTLGPAVLRAARADHEQRAQRAATSLRPRRARPPRADRLRAFGRLHARADRSLHRRHPERHRASSLDGGEAPGVGSRRSSVSPGCGTASGTPRSARTRRWSSARRSSRRGSPCPTRRRDTRELLVLHRPEPALARHAKSRRPSARTGIGRGSAATNVRDFVGLRDRSRVRSRPPSS